MRTPVQRATRKVKNRAATLSALRARVFSLEQSYFEMRADVTSLRGDLSEVQHTVQQMNERSQRGEKLMLEMQGDQRRMSKVLDSIAQTLGAKS